MNDDAPTPAENEGPPQPPTEGLPDAADEAALERLQALSDESTASPSEVPAAPSTADKVRSSLRRSSLRRQRPSTDGLRLARIVAPVVFLAAVIVVVVLLFQSGVIGGRSDIAVSPTPKASASSQSAATRAYVVKKGDTLSGIAAKFETTVGKLEDLNPDLSGSTLGVGDKITVPNK